MVGLKMMLGYGLRLFGLVCEMNGVLLVLEEVFEEGFVQCVEVRLQ